MSLRSVARAGGSAVLLIGLCSSAAPMDAFVASGAYARAVALAADCRQAYLPAMDPADQPEAPGANGVLRLISFRPQGSALAYGYRPLTTINPTFYHRETAEEYPELTTHGTTVRVDRYDTDERATTVLSEATTGGCVRLVLQGPATLQVGMGKNTVGTTQRLLDILGIKQAAVTEPAINPDTIKATVIIRTYVDGQLKGGQKVLIRTDPRGVPGRYGQTYPHHHLLDASGGSLAPTLRFWSGRSPQRLPGAELEVKTDNTGEAKATISPGYRGGPEAMVARWTPPGVTEVSVARAVVIRHKGGFVHFAQAFGYSASNPPKATDRFPFVFTGWTQRHFTAHYVRADKVQQMKDTWMAIWSGDQNRTKDGKKHYLVLNDASLEYGGLFHLNNGDDCSRIGSGAHATHTVGLDFDISPCYSVGNDGQQKVDASACETGRGYVKIDERILAARIIGDIGGAVKIHHQHAAPGEPADGVPYHYHVRFPQ